MVTTSATKIIKCEATRIESHTSCGALIAVRTIEGWEIVCPRCKTKTVLPV